MEKVLFIKKCLYGAKGEERDVTSAAANQYRKLGLIKEEKAEIKTKEEKEVIDTKEEVTEVKEEKAEEVVEEKQDSKEIMGTKKAPKGKVTKAPKF